MENIVRKEKEEFGIICHFELVCFSKTKIIVIPLPSSSASVLSQNSGFNNYSVMYAPFQRLSFLFYPQHVIRVSLMLRHQMSYASKKDYYDTYFFCFYAGLEDRNMQNYLLNQNHKYLCFQKHVFNSSCVIMKLITLDILLFYSAHTGLVDDGQDPL